MTTIKAKLVRPSVGFDLETGGLDPFVNPILQIGALTTDVLGNPTGKEFNRFIRPISSDIISPEAMAVNGLNLDWLHENGEDRKIVLQEFADWSIENAKDEYGAPVYFNWCLNFDLIFLYMAFQKNDIKASLASKYCIDIKSMAIGAGYRFRNSGDILKLWPSLGLKPHDGLNDAKTAAYMYRNILAEKNLIR